MAKIEKVSVSWHLSATIHVKVDGSDNWIKPGAEAGITFNDLPTEEQLDTASKHLIKNIIEPQIEDIVNLAYRELDEQSAAVIQLTGSGKIT